MNKCRYIYIYDYIYIYIHRSWYATEQIPGVSCQGCSQHPDTRKVTWVNKCTIWFLTTVVENPLQMEVSSWKNDLQMGHGFHGYLKKPEVKLAVTMHLPSYI